MKAAEVGGSSRKTVALRGEALKGVSLLGAMGGVALPVGIIVTRSSQDLAIGLVAAALAALLLVSLLQMLGVIGGR